MTCHDTIDWLLEAGPSELGCPQDQEILEHLAACRECRTRVARVVGDTAWLARMVPATSTVPVVPPTVALVPRVRRKWPAAVGAALAAASLVFVFARRDSRPERGVAARTQPVAVQPVERRATGGSPVSIASVKHAARVEQVAVPAPRSRPIEAAESVPVAYAAEAVAVTATFAPPAPARAVRLDTEVADRAPPRVEPRSSFAIDAGPSTGRYAVLQSTPKVAVVWFY